MPDQNTALTILGLAIAIKPVGDVAADFLKRVLGPSADAGGQVLAHPIQQYQAARVKRAQEMLATASDILESRGHAAQHVPGRILFPILEKASLEEDEAMQKL